MSVHLTVNRHPIDCILIFVLLLLTAGRTVGGVLRWRILEKPLLQPETRQSTAHLQYKRSQFVLHVDPAHMTARLARLLYRVALTYFLKAKCACKQSTSTTLKLTSVVSGFSQF